MNFAFVIHKNTIQISNQILSITKGHQQTHNQAIKTEHNNRRSSNNINNNIGATRAWV